jgi:asparagine synthase (glutamine-hydrolysing)
VRHNLPESLTGLLSLKRNVVSVPGLDIYWEASPSAPVSSATDERKSRRLAWIVGNFGAPYAKVSDAAQMLLNRSAEDSNLSCVSGQNGYYFAAFLDDTPRLVLGVDALGLFPLYYWTKGDVCLFGTSPQLFKHHPLFVAEPSKHAIASVLLVNHITGGKSLFEGVRRNLPGHYVEWRPGHDAREIEANAIRMSDRSFGATYSANVERVFGVLDDFHARLDALPDVGLFLSGGQDSRLVAGLVGRHLARKSVHAISIGRRSDQELRYAQKVARVYGWSHWWRDVEFNQYAHYAAGQLRMESLQGPFASFDTWTILPVLAASSGPFLSGYLGDAVMGDRHLRAAQSPKTGVFEFDELLAVLNGYGFVPSDVERLLSCVGGVTIVQEVMENLREEWRAIDALPFQAAWLFQLNNRQRFHVGSIIWRLSLGAWPLLPYYDRQLVDAVTSMPLDHLIGRRMQVDIIKKEFPRLATLPLDRNVVGADYLVSPLYRKFIPPLSEISWTLYRLLERGRERRYYHRTYDFNAQGWRFVRQGAERYRQQARHLFDGDALDKLLPPFDATPRYENMVRDASKTKTLLGLVMWYGMNFESGVSR